MATRMIAPDLVDDTAHGPRLVGGRNLADGSFVFPCPTGGEAARYRRVRLRPDGKLWSWTVQRFRPKSPPYAGPEKEGDFLPYMIGYVELEGEVIVESRLVGMASADPVIGMPLVLTLIPFRRDEDGVDVMTYAFRPAGDAP